MKYDPNLMEMAAGEETEQILTQVWSVPKGANLPEVRTISLEDELKKVVIKKILFDYECTECMDDPPRNLSIFYGDGLKFYADALKANTNARGLILLSHISQIKKIRRKLTNDFGVKANRIKIRLKHGLPYPVDLQFYIVPARR